MFSRNLGEADKKFEQNSIEQFYPNMESLNPGPRALPNNKKAAFPSKMYL